jgi:hypothetical protein
MNPEWKTQQFFRMWPRALCHMPRGKKILEKHLDKPRSMFCIGRTGKTSEPLIKRLNSLALKPYSRRYNFWTYFSAFEIADETHRDEIEAILISAMPTANSSRPKSERRKLDRDAAQLLNDFQALKLAGEKDGCVLGCPTTATRPESS